MRPTKMFNMALIRSMRTVHIDTAAVTYVRLGTQGASFFPEPTANTICSRYISAASKQVQPNWAGCFELAGWHCSSLHHSAKKKRNKRRWAWLEEQASVNDWCKWLTRAGIIYHQRLFVVLPSGIDRWYRLRHHGRWNTSPITATVPFYVRLSPDLVGAA